MVSKKAKEYCKKIEKEFRVKIDYKVLDLIGHVAEAKPYEFGYLVYLIAPNLFCEKEFNVISWYIKPEQRNIKNFMKIQRDIKKLAKDSGCRYIKQYSHLNPKLNRWLEKVGYTVSEYKKEI